MFINENIVFLFFQGLNLFGDLNSEDIVKKSFSFEGVSIRVQFLFDLMGFGWV